MTICSVAARFTLPARSVSRPASTYTSNERRSLNAVDGVSVAVYVRPEPLKSESVPRPGVVPRSLASKPFVSSCVRYATAGTRAVWRCVEHDSGRRLPRHRKSAAIIRNTGQTPLAGYQTHAWFDAACAAVVRTMDSAPAVTAGHTVVVRVNRPLPISPYCTTTRFRD